MRQTCPKSRCAHCSDCTPHQQSTGPASLQVFIDKPVWACRHSVTVARFHNIMKCSSPPDTMDAPHNVMAAPHKVMAAPHNVMDAPHEPHNIMDAPHNVMDAPHNVMAAPHNVMDAPHEPHNIMDAPHNIMDAPHNVMDAPHNVMDALMTPWMHHLTPWMYHLTSWLHSCMEWKSYQDVLGQISAIESSRKTPGSESVHKPPVSFSFSICVEVSCLTVQVTAQYYLCSRKSLQSNSYRITC